MEVMYVPAKIKSEVNVKKIQALKLPKSIAIAYSIQYIDIAEKVRKILSKEHEITKMIQVLGCSKSLFPENTQAILLIGSGRFHAVSLAIESSLPIYILEASEMSKISEEEIASFKKKKKASYINFLNSEKVGILVSAKPGQENLKAALELKKNNLKDKKFYLFIGNEFSSRELENFNDITSWINTACPRLDFDNPFVNMDTLNLGKPKNSL